MHIAPLSSLSAILTEPVQLEIRGEKYKGRLVTKGSTNQCIRSAQMVKLFWKAVSVIETASLANNNARRKCSHKGK